MFVHNQWIRWASSASWVVMSEELCHGYSKAPRRFSGKEVGLNQGYMLGALQGYRIGKGK